MIRLRRRQDLSPAELDALFNRFGDDYSALMVDTVIPIVTDVRKNGDAAVLRYTEKFDTVRLDAVVASSAEIDRGAASVDPALLEAFSAARDNITEFHAHQKRESIIYSRPDGTTLGVMYQPIERAAVYVPGGTACYPSSVLMGVIPAQIAGTRDITLITPPDRTGSVPPIVCAVARMLGIARIVKSGGAQGIAAAGLGTESVPRAHIIVGPGNIYVTAAKSYLFSLGAVQIDSMAGPSDVLVIADAGAPASWVAADLLSQAEHDPRAAAILVTDSEPLAREVQRLIDADLAANTGRADIKRKAIADNSLIVLVDSIDEAIAFSNDYAPEHMELMVDHPFEHLGAIRNVGSLFLGPHAPVPVGDYFSGTNHILPTGGAARFSSGLSVETFLRRTTFQHLTADALKRAEGPVRLMAEHEGFGEKHGGAVRVRFAPR
ncbi:MAG TPA: histidinol dehydrogenase [Spirochaetota bacterium]|nr:histidinol dehydrogenase [Spirochaetota bacterium]HPU88120.1 histidinol dehydrogenase [Spirochaetota bacterium]